MEFEYNFSVNSENKKNLLKLSSLQSNITERRLCELSEVAESAAELAYDMLNDGMNIYEALTLIFSGFTENEPTMRFDVLPENCERLKHLFAYFSSFDKAWFSQLFAEAGERLGRRISENDFLQSGNREETFTYVKNIYSDEAYDVFSQEFDDPRLRYSENFREAAKLVADGKVTYAILPLEESGARLSSIAELIYKHDLKINSVIPVFGIDGSADIKYALVSKQFSLSENAPGDDRYLEIRLPMDFTVGLGALSFAAEEFDVKLYRVNTMSYTGGEERIPCMSVVFSGEGVDFSILLIYLTLFVPEYTVVGLYNNLEE